MQKNIEMIILLFRNDLRNLKPDQSRHFDFLMPQNPKAFLSDLNRQGLDAGFGKMEMNEFIQGYELFLILNEEKAGYCSLDCYCRTAAIKFG